MSSSVVPFSSHLQSFPESGSFPVSRFFASGGPSIVASALASVLPINIQNWFPLGLAGLVLGMVKKKKKYIYIYIYIYMECPVRFEFQINNKYVFPSLKFKFIWQSYLQGQDSNGFFWWDTFPKEILTARIPFFYQFNKPSQFFLKSFLWRLISPLHFELWSQKISPLLKSLRICILSYPVNIVEFSKCILDMYSKFPGQMRRADVFVFSNHSQASSEQYCLVSPVLYNHNHSFASTAYLQWMSLVIN